MQATPRDAGGRRLSNGALKSTWVHQHGGRDWPLSRWSSIAHWLGCPHSGQQSGAEETSALTQAV